VVDVTRNSTLALAAGAALWLAGCQSTGNIGYPGATAPDSAIEAAVLHMPVGGQVMPPFGFVAFCLRDAKACEGGTDAPAEVALTPERWTELNEVNAYVNRAVAQVEDRDNQGVAEYWDFPNALGGDCEDLALLKRKMLIERGWPAEALLMTVARERSGDGHAVLTVTTDKGDYVLDNKNWAIVAWADAPYLWVKRQSPKRPYAWVSLDRPTARVMAEQSLPPLGAPAPFLAARKARMAPSATALRPTLDGEERTATPLERPQEGHAQTPIAAL